MDACTAQTPRDTTGKEHVAMIEDRECITNLLDSGEMDTRYTSEMHWANLVQKQSPKASELKIFASLPSLSFFLIEHTCIKDKDTVQIQIRPERIQRTAVPPYLHGGP